MNTENTNRSDDKSRVPFVPEIMELSSGVKMALDEVSDTASVFDEDGVGVDALPVPGYDMGYKYIPFGVDNQLPFHIIKTINKDEIMSQNMFFNVLTAYGDGLRYTDFSTGRPAKIINHHDPISGYPKQSNVGRFSMNNSLKEFFIEQATDMKYFFFSLAVVILNSEGTEIVQVRHKDACYVRFEKADGHGRIKHAFYCNWRKSSSLGRKDVEVIQLLDEKCPLQNLEVLMGRAYGADGEKRMRTTNRKFGIVMRFPTPGLQYYPTPYYTAIFRGDWFDLKRLIGKGKKAKIRNHAGVKYLVEIDHDYWNNLFLEENIMDPKEQKERMKREKENIRQFVTGIENSGKMWVSGVYTNPNGIEQHMIRITVVDSGREGGDWSEDIQEAANMICYGTNIHPNLVGATPGKSQSNNSGSDKRELFTLKQSLETAFRDMLKKVHDVIIYYNGWDDAVEAEVPLILLTTLDKKTDAIKVTQDGRQITPNEF